MSKRFVGVDVSQDHLDVFVRPINMRQRFPNTEDGIQALIAWVQPHTPEKIVFESTGPYQKRAVTACLAEGLPAVVVNARQVRDFAKAMKYSAKTDKIDAAVIAHFSEVADCPVKPLESQEIQALRELYDRRAQLVHLKAIEKNRLHSAKVAQASKSILESFETLIAFLETQISDVENRMDQLIQTCEEFQTRQRVLRTITGIGPHVARTLIAHLPELGKVSRQKIAALVGLAPFNDDSGQHCGARHIRGGRSKVRVGLYQAAVAALRHCPQTKETFAALKARGKASRVAIIAIARKILVLANAMVRDMQPYRPAANSV